MGINGDKRNGVFSGFIPQNPEIRGRGRGYTSLEVRGGDGDGGKQNFWGFLGEKPRKSSIFGAGTGDTISGIFNRNPENPEIAVYSFQSYIIKPRGTPSPAPKLGDGVGTGEVQVLGFFRG